MLEMQRNPDGSCVVFINYSSLSLLQTCLRKSYYTFVRKLVMEDEADALAFGSSIHKALEHYYQLDESDRELAPADWERAKLMAHGHGIESPARGALESIRQFVIRGQAALGALPESDKRSLFNGVAILRAYFKQYAKDGWTVARDFSGPMIERAVEFEMHSEPGLTIRYHGSIDVVLRNVQSGEYVIADHKTTAALGREFYNRCKPNPQYTGYVWAANACLGVKTNLFMVNGIQVAKTKHEFARQITSRDAEDFLELKQSVIKAVKAWLTALELGEFPQTAPDPCSMYGGCRFLELCSVPQIIRENIIDFKYGKLAAASAVETKKPQAQVLPTHA